MLTFQSEREASIMFIFRTNRVSSTLSFASMACVAARRALLLRSAQRGFHFVRT